jgi:hypothetical protein
MLVSALGHHVGERYNHHCLEGIVFRLSLLAVIMKAWYSLPTYNKCAAIKNYAAVLEENAASNIAFLKPI